MNAVVPGGVVTRFAPSPTGRLHLGHAYSAVAAHDYARQRGGTFRLRIEDIDAARSRADHVEAIFADLRWLGLDWDGPVLFQSRRLERYGAALDSLKRMGLVYPCFCTRAEIAREVAASVRAPHGPEGAVYPGTCRGLGADERQQRIAAEPHSWRLDVAKALSRCRADLVWRDEIAGTVAADPAMHGDVVLARKDAPASYHLAVTVDDAAQGVSHVVRGRDLFASTHVHRLLQALLALPTPVYRHHRLLADAEGRRLAKRDGAPSLEALRLAGEDGAALADDLRSGRLPVGIGAANA